MKRNEAKKGRNGNQPRKEDFIKMKYNKRRKGERGEYAKEDQMQ